MKPTGHHGGWVIILTFVISFILTIMPMPQVAIHLRPEWSALVLLYWCMALPQRIGVGTGWIVGLLLDVLKGSLLGQHALALAVIAYLILNLHQRVRLFPLWQQAVVVMMLLNLSQLLLLWFDGITGQPAKGLQYWLPPLVAMLIWPGVFMLLRGIRRYYKIR